MKWQLERFRLKAKSTGETLEAIFTKEPVAPVRLNSKVPAELERIICKAMEKDRNLRYQSAADMRTDLQRLKTRYVLTSEASVSAAKATKKHKSLDSCCCYYCSTTSSSDLLLRSSDKTARGSNKSKDCNCGFAVYQPECRQRIRNIFRMAYLKNC